MWSGRRATGDGARFNRPPDYNPVMRSHLGSIWTVRFVTGGALAGLLGSIVWAALESGIDDGIRQLLGFRWGVVTLIDVYAGGLVVALWIRSHQPRLWVWLVWVAALALAGNAAALAYLLLRARRARSLRDLFGASPAAEARAAG